MFWYISDTHFGHANIIRYTNRPFLKNGDLDTKGNWISQEIAKERCKWMDETIIRNWNERVKKDDIILHLGDFCFKRCNEAISGNIYDYYANQFNGKIILIKGNHEKNQGTKTIMESCVIFQGGHRIYCVHDPKYYNPKYKINFVGHVHEKWQFKQIENTLLVNLSVEWWGYRPVNINEIMGKVYKFKNGKN